MEQVKTAEGLAGKTIARAVIQSYQECMILVFTDGSFANVTPDRGYDNDVDITLGDTADEFALLGAGLLTQAEYDANEARRLAAERAAWEDRERQQFARLAAKYGTPSPGAAGGGK